MQAVPRYYFLMFDYKEPLYLSTSQIDHTFDTESRNKAVDIMNAGNKIYHLQLFSGVEHGFALRGKMDNAYERSYHCLKRWSPLEIKYSKANIPGRLGQRTEFEGHYRLV